MNPYRCATNAAGKCERISLGAFIDCSEKVGRVEVYRCINCGHAISHPPLPDVSFLYSGRQSQDYQPDSRNSVSRFVKDLAFRIQVRRLLRDMGPIRGRLLDYGCGSGQFTRVLDDVAAELDVTGCDFFVDPPEQFSGRRYMPHSEVAQMPGAFDAVIAMHVLEHDDEIDRLLSSISSTVKVGGVVVIEVPNVDCIWSSIFGRFWDAWYLPYHRHHFSRVSLEAVLRAGGLDVTSIRGVTAPTMGRTLAKIFGRKNSAFWVLVGIVLHPIQFFGEFVSGRRTALRAFCTKPI